MSRPKRPTDNRWTNRAHGYRDEDSAALTGGRWVRRGLVWVWQAGERADMRASKRSAA